MLDIKHALIFSKKTALVNHAASENDWQQKYVMWVNGWNTRHSKQVIKYIQSPITLMANLHANIFTLNSLSKFFYSCILSFRCIAWAKAAHWLLCYSQGHYRTLIGSHTPQIDWYHLPASPTTGSAQNRDLAPTDFGPRYLGNCAHYA